MNPTLRRIALGPHPDLALSAFTKFRRFVQTGIMSEEQVRANLKFVASSSIPATEAEEAISRAAARRDKK